MPESRAVSVGKLPRRNFISILVSLLGISAIAWWYLFSLSADMPPQMSMADGAMMPLMAMPQWTPVYALMMFIMWAVMMAGMMLPSVTPVVMIYALVARKAQQDGKAVAATGFFVSGYLLVWVGFSVVTVTAQFYLEQWGLLSAMMTSTSKYLGSTLLLAAGSWQFTPLKDTCLHQCRSPVEFISSNWKNGNAGAVIMGLHHGLYCLGCCWALMLLLFVGGVMNLLWIAILAIFVLLEKIAPFGRESGKITGTLMIGAGLYVLLV